MALRIVLFFFLFAKRGRKALKLENYEIFWQAKMKVILKALMLGGGPSFMGLSPTPGNICLVV